MKLFKPFLLAISMNLIEFLYLYFYFESINALKRMSHSFNALNFPVYSRGVKAINLYEGHN
jgi:hypothetical protein